MFKISARNQFPGTVVAVKEGAVNGVVTIEIAKGVVIKADITMESIRDLGLTEGKKATAIVKATNVFFALGTDRLPMSARNQFAGKVVSVKEGAVNGHVVLETADGLRFSGSITNEAIEELGLTEGTEAMAVVKATDVLVGVEE
jgi:molybdate transport system regulatory protein